MPSRTSTLDKLVQFTVRFAAADWELSRRMSVILYRGVVRDFVARAVVERCIAVGTVKVPGRPVPLPRDAASAEEACSQLATYQDALAKRIEELKAYFIRPQTRMHLVKVLATFPNTVDARYVAAPYKKPPVDSADDERPASLALLPLHLDAAKAAAAKTTDGSLTAFVIDAMAAKADSVGMRSPRATMPTFARYPAAPLFGLQRNIEEPALALIAAHEQLAQRTAGSMRLDRVRASCDRLLGALLEIQLEQSAS